MNRKKKIIGILPELDLLLNEAIDLEDAVNFAAEELANPRSQLRREVAFYLSREPLPKGA